MWGERVGKSIRARRRRGCCISANSLVGDNVGGRSDSGGSEGVLSGLVLGEGTYHTPIARVKPTMLTSTHLNHRTRPMRHHALCPKYSWAVAAITGIYTSARLLQYRLVFALRRSWTS